MSSELFAVRIVAVERGALILEVKDTYEGISPPETETFFLAALREHAVAREAPLGTSISDEQILSEEWLEQNVRRFISRVEVLTAALPTTANYRVLFVDPALTRGLRKGASWNTASYDVGDPILRRELERLGMRPLAPKRAAAKKKKKTAIKTTAVKKTAVPKTTAVKKTPRGRP